MASVLDMHVAVYLQHQWREVVSRDVDAFRDLLSPKVDDSPEPIIPDEWVQDWFKVLVPGGRSDFVKFLTSYKLDAVGSPQVTVDLHSERPEAQHLGNLLVDRAGPGQRAVLGLDLEQTIAVTLLTSNKEIARALYAALRAMMLRCNLFLIESVGYAGLRFAGGGDLHPEERFGVEATGLFLREQRWSGVATEYTTSTDVEPRKPWYVYAEDLVVDGHPGGAHPKEDA